MAGLLALAAVGAGSGFALAKHARSHPLVPDMPAIADYLVLALVLAIIAIEIAALKLSLGEMGQLPARRQRRTLRTLLSFAGICLVLVFLPQRIRDWLAHHGTTNRPAQQAQQAPPPQPKVKGPARSRGLGLMVTGVLALALFATVGGFAWYRVSQRPSTRTRDRLAEELAAEIDAGIEELEGIADPRLAVLACYDRMQRAIDASGLGRRVSDTPREVVLRVLEERSVAAPSARRLAGLFERARFSQHSVDEGMRLEALACLRDVRDQLLAEPEPAPDEAPVPA